MVSIRTAEDRDFARVRASYRAAGYAGMVTDADRVLLAEEDSRIVGVVRLASENGVIVLRGMRVAPDYQRRGVGSLLLDACRQTLGRQDCYCIPYEHLLDFYGRIGFERIDPANAPPFLATRLEEYRGRRPERFCLMLRRSP